jgi:hypothetical protein
MVGRPKTIADDADKLRFSLSPEEQAVLQLIRAKRKKSGKGRTNESEIVADGLWHIAEAEGIPREAVEKLIAPEPPTDTNVREFRKKEQT